MIYEVGGNREWRGCVRVSQDPERVAIRRVMEDSLKNGTMLVSVFSKSKNMIYEGVKVIGAATNNETGAVLYSLSNGDSNYCSLVGSVELGDINWVQTL